MPHIAIRRCRRQPIRAAYHAAAHGMMGLFAKRPAAVSLGPGGRCAFDPRPGGGADDVGTALLLLAGPVGEVLAMGGESPACASDLTRARKFTGRLHGGDADRWLSGARRDVDQLLGRYQRELEAVATWLLRRGALSGEEIAGIVLSIPDEPDPREEERHRWRMMCRGR